MLVIGSNDYVSSPLLSPRERAAVLWAEHVARNTARERDDILDQVRQYFTIPELVELTAACGTFASSNRFQDSMGIPLEAAGEINKIKRSLRVDTNKLKDYIGQLLEQWPGAFPEPSESVTHERDEAPRATNSWHSVRGPGPASPLPLVDPALAQGEAARFIHASEQLFGFTTNATLMWAHIPYIAKLWPPYQLVMEREGLGGRLPSMLKAMALVRTAHLNRADYSLAHRTALARAAGVAEETLDLLSTPNCPDSAVFAARQRAMLRWVDEVATNMAKKRGDLFNALKEHFDDAELVELTGLCAMANQIDLTLNALRVPLESEAEIEKGNRSVRMDPERIRAYLKTVYTHWPETFPAQCA